MVWSIKGLRDTAMFMLGGGGFVHELVVTRGERPTLLLACLALMGVPFMLRKDEADSPAPPADKGSSADSTKSSASSQERTNK